MADKTITASAVRPASKSEAGLSGAAVGIGKSVAKLSTGLWVHADSNDAAQSACTEYGISANSTSGTGQPLVVGRGGLMTMDGLTAGEPVFVSSTAGGICQAADVTSGCKLIILGGAVSATVLNLGPGPIVGGTVA